MADKKVNAKSKKLKRTAIVLSAVFCFAPVSAKDNNHKKIGNKNKADVGLSVTYNKNHAINDVWGVYEIKGNDGQSIKITKEVLDGYAMSEKENRLHEQVFSEECKVVYKLLDWQLALDCVKNGKYSMATYMIGKNVINIYRSAETKESISQRLKTAQEKNDANEIMACAYLWLLKQIEEEPERLEEVLVHEKTHQYCDFDGVNKVSNITGKQAAKLDMLNEIKATINQVALGYEKYKITGNLDDIKGANAGELINFKNWLHYNNDKSDTQECKLRLAKAVYQGFLEQNNIKGAYYYYQVMKKNHTTGRQAGAIVENTANIKEYYRRVDMMFKNTSLGDVRSAINPDFKLGGRTKIETKEDIVSSMSEAEKLLYIITDEALTVEEATACIKEMLSVVKKTDEDGVRTRREQRKIDKAINFVLAGKCHF